MKEIYIYNLLMAKSTCLAPFGHVLVAGALLVAYFVDNNLYAK